MLFTDAGSRARATRRTRSTTLNTSGRIALWREAARQSRYVRDAGTGAGTFPFSHYRFREGGGVVKHAHSQWFNVLSELGVVGLTLFVAAVVLFVAAMVGNPFARRRDPLHPLLVALQAGVIAFFVHMSCGLGLGHGGGRDGGLRLHRRVRLLPFDAARGRATSGGRPRSVAARGGPARRRLRRGAAATARRGPPPRRRS